MLKVPTSNVAAQQVRIVYDLKQDEVTLEVANASTEAVAAAVANIIQRVTEIFLESGVRAEKIRTKMIVACSIGVEQGMAIHSAGGAGGANAEKH